MTNEENNRQLKELLKRVMPPVQGADLRHDLWPQMLRKLEEQPSHITTVPWFDWALAAILGAVLVFFPASIPAC